MGKGLVRIFVILVAIYFIVSYLLAQLFGVDILCNIHTVLFELIVVVYCYSEGKYHCRFMKYTALAILISDTLTRLDYMFNFLSVTAHNVIPLIIMVIGITTSLTKAFKHFHRVNKIKNGRK